MNVGRVISWGQWWLIIGTITLICAGLMIGIEECSGSIACLTRAGGLTRSQVLSAPWQLLSYGWLHADQGHIAGNLSLLWLVSIPLLRALKPSRFLLLYLGSILSSGLAILLESGLWGVVSGTDPVAVGASGGVFGLLGALAAYAIRPDGVFHDIEAVAVRACILPILGLGMIQSFYPGVSFGGHAGGFAFGFAVCALGWARAGMPVRADPTLLDPLRWGPVIAVTLLLLSTSACVPILGDLFLFGFLLLTIYGGHLVTVYEPPFQVIPALLALVAVTANGAAIGIAWQQGRIWEITPPLRAAEVQIHDSLPPLKLPRALADARVETETGVTFGDPHQFPVALAFAFEPRPQTEEEAIDSLLRHPAGGPWLRASLDGCPRVWILEKSRFLLQDHILDLENTSLGTLHGPWAKLDRRIGEQLQSGTCGEPLSAAGKVHFWLSLDIRGNQRAALDAVHEGLEADPDDLALLLLRTAISERFDGCEHALEAYNQLAAAGDQHVDLSAGLARTTFGCDRSETGGAKGALPHIEQALAIGGASDWKLHELHGEILVTLGDGEAAAEALKQAISLVDDAGEKARLDKQATQYAKGVRLRAKIGG